MVVFLLFSLILSISFLVTSIVLIFTPSYPYFILFFMLFCVFLLISMAFFQKYTKKYPRNPFEDFKVKNIKQYIKYDCENNYVIEFELKNGVWECENNNLKIKMDLKGYLFQKSFIIAYVIRQQRYKLTNGKRKVSLLHKKEIELFDFKHRNLFVLFKYNNKSEKIQIVYNGVSRHTPFSRLITAAPRLLEGKPYIYYEYISENEESYRRRR